MIDYTWKDWLVELATKIATNDETYLIERARTVDWLKDDVPLLAYGDENIDPMSFLYFLAQRNTANQFGPIFRSVHKVFDIGLDFPESQPFIPVPTPNTPTLFHDGNSFRPDLLWHLFRQAAPIHANPTIEPKDFDAVLNLPKVGLAKLTQTLFIANPRHYLPAFSRAKVILGPHPELEGFVNSYGGYVRQAETLRRFFPGCDAYEINIFLITQDKDPLISKKTDFFQISTRAYGFEKDSPDYWEQTGELEEDLLFNENHYVYTGYDGGNRKYRLQDPKRGDVILVRCRPMEGRAIGIVAENGYSSDGWSEKAVIHVHWINKNPAHLGDMEQVNQMSAFNRPDKLLSAFRNSDVYKVSFDWIDRLTGNVKSAARFRAPE